MRYGPNSEQLEAYVRQVADLDADDWASLALALKDTAGSRDAAATAIETARSRAGKHGLLGDVDAATRESLQTMGSVLDASTGLRDVVDRAFVRVGPDDPSLGEIEWDAGVVALRAAATSGATLLVLRPLLNDDEFAAAWPMPVVDPRNLPSHMYVPPIGAAG